MTTKHEKTTVKPSRPRGRPPKPKFTDLVPKDRPAKSVHPQLTASFGTPKRAKPDTSAITADSSYHEFAWEFLRRNRFYQALIDDRDGCLPETEWGFEWHTEVPRHHGLVENKPYWETYDEGRPPQWRGLDDFAQRLPTKPTLRPRTETVELRPGQVLVVYDLSGFIYGQSPLSPQLWAAHVYLEKLATRPFPKKSFWGKPMHRDALLRRLKLFDEISAGTPLADACKELGYPIRGEQELLDDPLTRMAQNLMKGKRRDPVTTAYEHLDEAYALVYHHGYLAQLLGEKAYTVQGTKDHRSLVADRLINRRNLQKTGSKKGEK